MNPKGVLARPFWNSWALHFAVVLRESVRRSAPAKELEKAFHPDGGPEPQNA